MRIERVPVCDVLRLLGGHKAFGEEFAEFIAEVFASKGIYKADIEGWVLFPKAPFAPFSTASCQRCAQLVSSATARERSTNAG